MYENYISCLCAWDKNRGKRKTTVERGSPIVAWYTGMHQVYDGEWRPCLRGAGLVLGVELQLLLRMYFSSVQSLAKAHARLVSIFVKAQVVKATASMIAEKTKRGNTCRPFLSLSYNLSKANGIHHPHKFTIELWDWNHQSIWLVQLSQAARWRQWSR